MPVIPMALKDLTTPQMLAITAAWIDPTRERPKLESLKRTAALLSDVDAVHTGLLHARRAEKTTSKEIAELQSRQLHLDKTHDRKARGTHAVLTGFAELADDPEDAELYLNIRDQLFPDGLKFITSSYADEAGHAHLLRQRLTPESKAALKVLPTPAGSLLKIVLAWLSAGEELGKLETKKAQLIAAERPAEGVPQGGQLKARNRWIKVVGSVLAMLDLEEVDTDTQRLLLAPLHDVMAKAERIRSGNADDSVDANEASEGQVGDPNRDQGSSGPA